MIVKMVLSIMFILVQLTVSQSLKLLQTLGSSSADAVLDLKFDKQGDLYIVGERGTGNDETITLSSSLSLRFGTSKTRSFIAKFDSTGTEFKGIIVADSGQRITSIDIDSLGAIYATGSLNCQYGNCGFGKRTSWSPPYTGDFFVAKYNNNLERVWSVNSKSGGAFGTDIKCDSNGCVFCGTYNMPTTLDTFKINTPAGQCCDNMHSNSNAFIGRIDANGKCIFFRNAGKGLIYTRRMEITSSGEIFLTGYACLFMSPETDSSNITGTGPLTYICSPSKGFLSKYSSDGTFQWVKQSQNKDTVSDCNAIAVNSSKSEVSTSTIFGNNNDALTISNCLISDVNRLSFSGESLWIKIFKPYNIVPEALGTCSYGYQVRICDLGYSRNEELIFAGKYFNGLIFEDDTIGRMGAGGIGVSATDLGFVGCILPDGHKKWITDLTWKPENDSGHSKFYFHRFAIRGERIFTTGVYSTIITNDSTVTSRGDNDIFIAEVNPDQSISVLKSAANVSMANWKMSLQRGLVCLQGKGNDEVAISIYNILGKRIFPSSGECYVKPGNMIPVTDLANGSYFVMITSKNQMQIISVTLTK
ncbi:MAG TPA: hypothetical protein VKO63_01350 [Chitinispirillaceae bacterium]|nr:hypothetical protein [Chitinispirillaceae bacterium]